MSNLNRSAFQGHPFHLVSPSPLPILSAYIHYLKQFNNNDLRECDYSKMLAIALPQFFPLIDGWFITAEFVLTGNYAPDYLVGKIVTTPGPNYGKSVNHLVVETKKKGAVSWQYLMKDQLFNQCEAAKLPNGRIFCIALIGFEICFFEFDITKHDSPSDAFTGFNPINLHDWKEEDFDILEIELIVETTNFTTDIIKVIKWRMDNPNHHGYIMEMFEYIKTNTP